MTKKSHDITLQLRPQRQENHKISILAKLAESSPIQPNPPSCKIGELRQLPNQAPPSPTSSLQESLATLIARHLLSLQSFPSEVPTVSREPSFYFYFFKVLCAPLQSSCQLQDHIGKLTLASLQLSGTVTDLAPVHWLLRPSSPHGTLLLELG